MNGFATFLVKDLTKDGYAMAIAGICPFSFTDSMEDEISGLIRNYSFKPIDDVFMTDYFMAQYFSRFAPEYVLAWGITMHVPQMSGPTGGIIGNPHIEANSANSTGEYIGSGLSVAAHPGGPGIVIAGDPQTAREILSLSEPSDGGKTPLLAMAKRSIDFNIPAAIMITDGTGFNAVGCALTIEGSEIKYISLDRSALNEY
ncbi:conserved protein of unknown function [Tepidanaerobacter acetatoxydans Re1]|uniref:Uncharacterized protein n=1 Tax=Tepidanaerobacter acetatoxydans (strain DSM 21804 / JCM 16047 / Re1) TaxID=1209989 RepID=F4LS88_TEPAE|nr:MULTISPECIES: hypothetical protein [Tepidanaerobacter]AEE90351.1 hypothetical protein TepRe1_0142 [Tepidanaerobacter acetatoxydans Re1]CCP24841.1 conserved protein of unknown function [Tepidanaerobacter acetatoxydans Re1]HHV83287.1 hypothetical protein [Tepidanaerobacter syntrophicus]